MSESAEKANYPAGNNPTEKDQAIESFRRRSEEAAQAAIFHRDDDLDNLAPDVAEAKIHMREELAQMAGENSRRTSYSSSRNYRSLFSESPPRPFSARDVVTLLAPIVAASALWAGTTAITESNYGPEKAQRYLEQQGYESVSSTATNIFLIDLRGCGAGDFVQYEFDAQAPNGDHVAMMVCKGLFKAATIRSE